MRWWPLVILLDLKQATGWPGLEPCETPVIPGPGLPFGPAPATHREGCEGRAAEISQGHLRLGLV